MLSFFTSFLSSFHFIYFYCLLIFLCSNLSGSNRINLCQKYNFWFKMNNRKSFANIKLLWISSAMLFSLVSPIAFKHCPFLVSTVPCSFFLYTSDNKLFNKGIFRLIYISLQTFLLLNFSLLPISQSPKSSLYIFCTYKMNPNFRLDQIQHCLQTLQY